MNNMEDSADVKVLTNGGLMKHTKAQLCEIILRKDNVEKQLQEDNKTLLETLEQLNKNYNEVKTIANKATQDFKETLELCQTWRNMYKANESEYTIKFLNIFKCFRTMRYCFCYSFIINVILLAYIIYKVCC